MKKICDRWVVLDVYNNKEAGTDLPCACVSKPTSTRDVDF